MVADRVTCTDRSRQGFVKVCVTVRDRQNVRKTAH